MVAARPGRLMMCLAGDELLVQLSTWQNGAGPVAALCCPDIWIPCCDGVMVFL